MRPAFGPPLILRLQTDGRYLISKLKSHTFKVRSLTTISTPHRGSTFADWCLDELVGQQRIATTYRMLRAIGIGTGAFDNLTTRYCENVFNREIVDDPDVAYFSYGAACPCKPAWYSPFHLPWKV